MIPPQKHRSQALEQLLEIAEKAKKIVVFTGSGLSATSGAL
jgi:NAD-dependent SIR2 family protein deacetylase